MSKIIFVNRFFYPDQSATSQLLTDLAFDLADNNESIEVICSRQDYDSAALQQKHQETVHGVNINRVRSTNFGRIWLPGRIMDYLSYFMGLIIQLIRIVKKDDIVVVKTDPPLCSILVYPIVKMKGGIQVNWVQDLFPEVATALNIKLLPSIVAKMLQKLRNYSFKKSRLTVVIGQIMKEKLIAQGIPAEKIRILSNWADKNIVYPVSKQDNRLLEAWGLRGKFVVGYSGNLGRVHEFDEIIRAAQDLQDQKDIMFVFIGNGPQKSSVEAAVSNLNLSNVIFFPYQDYQHLHDSISLPDVHLISLKPAIEGYCVPSKFYGVVAAAKPVIFIGDTQGEVANLLQNDASGIAVQSKDSQALSEAILHLYHQPQEVQKMGQNALNAFQTKYEKTHLLRHWREALHQI